MRNPLQRGSHLAWLCLTATLCAGVSHAQESAAPAQPVTVAKVRKVDFPLRIESLGTTRANESIEVTSKVAEVIDRILFEEGQLVAKGQVLVELASEEARANLAMAEANAMGSLSDYERGLGLSKTKSISASDLQQLQAVMEADRARVQAAKARLADRVIRAPFGGRVGLRKISVGSLVSPGTVITTLDDLSIIKLDFAMAEVYLALLEPGLEVGATSAAYPERSFSGEVASIATRVDPVTRSVAATALLPNDEGLLKPGMFMSVEVTQTRNLALVIPEQAIVPEQEYQYVFLAEGDKAMKQAVRTGRRRPGEVEILSGLQAGDMVVVEGNQNLRDGSAIEVLTRISRQGAGEKP